MKKIYFLTLKVLFLFIGINIINAQYDDGLIIANEGNFGGYNASVTFFNRQTQAISNNIYNTVNNEDVGDVLQNVGVYEDKAYLVVNNSNKVIIVDRVTFVKETVITDHISQPRYITFANGKYYVTNSDAKSVTVYDIETNEFLSEIVIGSTVERIKAIGNHIFVQDVWFGTGNSVSVIDATTDEVVNTLEFESGVNGLDVDNEYAYVLSSGSSDNGETYTHVYKIDGESLSTVANVRTTNISSGGKLTVSDEVVYFNGNGTNIYAYSVDNLTGEPVFILGVTENSWSTLYGFDVINGYLFDADANGFTAPSSVKVYNVTSGNLLLSFTAGMGTNGFYPSFSNMGTSDIASNKLDVSVYPNPIVDYVELKGVDSAKVQVYNVNGKLVKSIDYNGQKLNMSELNTGLYFFVISTENSKVTKKVLVK